VTESVYQRATAVSVSYGKEGIETSNVT